MPCPHLLLSIKYARSFEAAFSLTQDSQVPTKMIKMPRLPISFNFYPQMIETSLLRFNIIQLHMFSELVWVSIFQNNSGLTEGNHQGRMADIFPEQIQGQDGLLGSGLVVNLLTVIIMAALGNLISNVLPIDPKLLEPKMSANDNQLRNMGNI
ncbi:hypothetical protein BDR06DRAFT_968728 [Suillus hirtellus]|nr:hypothetical protein BDR06DRAFT_968728 [Suillus hirtellus]